MLNRRPPASALIVASLPLLVCLPGPAFGKEPASGSPRPQPLSLGLQKQLFVDDYIIEKKEHLTR
ncbi:MAG: hypothetical protein OSB83_17270, partial [Planctomycetota bacterium]|nr:hypothetical protein [Planctomycetota bacterium]